MTLVNSHIGPPGSGCSSTRSRWDRRLPSFTALHLACVLDGGATGLGKLQTRLGWHPVRIISVSNHNSGAGLRMHPAPTSLHEYMHHQCGFICPRCGPCSCLGQAHPASACFHLSLSEIFPPLIYYGVDLPVGFLESWTCESAPSSSSAFHVRRLHHLFDSPTKATDSRSGNFTASQHLGLDHWNVAHTNTWPVVIPHVVSMVALFYVHSTR